MTDSQHNWQQVKADALRTAASIILPVELTLHIDELDFSTKLDGNLRFVPLGLEGLSAVNIHSPDGHTVMLIRGVEGAHSKRVSVAQAVTVNVLEGSLLYFIEGSEPRLVEAWAPGLDDDCARISFKAGEPHGFVVIKPCLNYSIFTPTL